VSDISPVEDANMFGWNHPQPPYRKEVAMQIVQHEQQRRDHTLTVEPPGGNVGAPLPATALRFDVVYTLGEYLSVLCDHIGFLLSQAAPAKRRRDALLPLALGVPTLVAAWLMGAGTIGTILAVLGLGALACHPATLRLWVLLIGTPVFLVKKRRMPRCAFRIDGAGIERTTRLGTFVRTWSELQAVRRYRRGYLLVFGKGAVPIPYRCLDGKQQEAFRRFVLNFGHGHGQQGSRARRPWAPVR
jgi:hypothetical protein